MTIKEQQQIEIARVPQAPDTVKEIPDLLWRYALGRHEKGLSARPPLLDPVPIRAHRVNQSIYCEGPTAPSAKRSSTLIREDLMGSSRVGHGRRGRRVR